MGVRRTSSSTHRKLWPYILPLPPTEQYSLLSSVFASEVSVKILQLIAITGRVYQKDLISQLHEYSNKTVIAKLRRLVSSGVLREGMEKRRVSEDKTGWVKWYEPTFLGKWLSLLLLPPEKIPKLKAEKILLELFEYYLKNAVKLCHEYGIDPKLLKKAFNSAISEY